MRFYVFLFFISSSIQLHGLKLLFFDHTFPALTQTFILNQITAMIDRGHDVTILSLAKSDYAKQHPVEGTKPAWHPDIEKYNLIDRTYYGSLPKDKRSFDVVLCEFGHLGNMFLYKRKQLNIKGKFITFFRGRDLNALPGSNKKYYSNLFKQGDFFLPVCNYFRLKLIRMGCPEKKIGVLHSTIDTSKFEFKERRLNKDGKVRFITTNRLVEKKGTEYAIKAVAKVAKKYPNIEYNIIGGGPLYKKLNKLIFNLKMQDKIHLLGWRSHEEVRELLDSSDIFILASVKSNDGDGEGIPNAINEAMASGLPVVSTIHSGIPESVKNRKTGFLVPERDTNKMAKCLEYLIEHHEVWAQMGKLGRMVIEQHFDKNIENRRLENVCKYLARAA